MEIKVFTGLFVFVLFIFFVTLFRDSTLAEKIMCRRKNLRRERKKEKTSSEFEQPTKKKIERQKPARENNKTETFNGPIVYVYSKGDDNEDGSKRYQNFVVNKKMFSIGRETDKKAKLDISLNFPYISRKQAEIFQDEDEEEGVIYYLRNVSRNTKMEYLVKDKGRYQWLDYRDEVLLEGIDVFYIGDIKILTVTRQRGHAASKTDGVRLPGKEVSERRYDSDDMEL